MSMTQVIARKGNLHKTLLTKPAGVILTVIAAPIRRLQLADVPDVAIARFTC